MEFGLIFLIIVILILFYLIGGGLLEHYKIHVIHETGLGIIMGMIVGFAIYEINFDFYHNNVINTSTLLRAFYNLIPVPFKMIFEGELFFYFILPPIIFAGGYNLKKRRFFQNFFYINVYGLIGTIVNFIVVWLLTYLVNEADLVRRYSDFSQSVTLSNRDILLFSATICATDSVAALAMIKPDKHPKLFSVIFGEGMVNDSVSIILYNSVLNLVGSDTVPKVISFTFVNFLKMVGEFFKNSLCSLAIGAAWGLLATYLTKKFRFLSHNPVVETVVVLLFGLGSFATSEVLELSGVISILVTGIVMSHYLFYNISASGKVTSGVTFASLATIAEAVLYIYLGIIFWQSKGDQGESNSYAWSWTFLILEICIAFFARFVSVFVVSWLIIIIKGRKKWRLNRYEMGIIWFAGIIRGAIAFALIQNVPGDPSDEAIQIIQSTTLFIVIITTVVLGGIMPNYIKVVLRQIAMNPKYHSDHPSIKDTLLEGGEQKKDKDYKSGSQKKWKGVDESFIKPLFIYNYAERKDEIAREKLKLKMNSEAFDAAGFFRKPEADKHGDDGEDNHSLDQSSEQQDSDPVIDNAQVIDVEQASGSLDGSREKMQRTSSINQERVLGVKKEGDKEEQSS